MHLTSSDRVEQGLSSWSDSFSSLGLLCLSSSEALSVSLNLGLCSLFSSSLFSLFNSSLFSLFSSSLFSFPFLSLPFFFFFLFSFFSFSSLSSLSLFFLPFLFFLLPSHAGHSFSSIFIHLISSSLISFHLITSSSTRTITANHYVLPEETPTRVETGF